MRKVQSLSKLSQELYLCKVRSFFLCVLLSMLTQEAATLMFPKASIKAILFKQFCVSPFARQFALYLTQLNDPLPQ